MLHHVAPCCTPHQFAQVHMPGRHELSIGIHCFCSITQGAIRDALHELLNGGLLLATGTGATEPWWQGSNLSRGQQGGSRVSAMCVTKDPARRCSRTLPYKHGTVTGLSHRDSIHLAHLGYTHQLWCCFPWWKRGVYWICPAAEQIHTNDTALLYKRFKATVWHCRVCNRNRFLQQRLGKVQTFAVHSSSTRASEGQVEVLLVGWQKANTCKKGPNMSQLQSIIGGQNGPTVVLTVRNVRSFRMASMVVLRDLQTCSHSGTVPQIGFVEVTIQLCHHLLQA